MPLLKKGSTTTAEPPAQETPTVGQLAKVEETKKTAAKKAVDSAPMTKDDYWRRREERDIQRDKDMAWSGLAQAALTSVGLVQFNTGNTVEGLVELVAKTTNLLLAARDKRNG